MMQYQTGTSLLEDTVGNPRTEFPRSELLHFLQDAQDFAPVRGRFPGVRRIVGTPRLGRLAVVAVMAMVLTNFRWNCTPSYPITLGKTSPRASLFPQSSERSR